MTRYDKRSQKTAHAAWQNIAHATTQHDKARHSKTRRRTTPHYMVLSDQIRKHSNYNKKQRRKTASRDEGMRPGWGKKREEHKERRREIKYLDAK